LTAVGAVDVHDNAALTALGLANTALDVDGDVTIQTNAALCEEDVTALRERLVANGFAAAFTADGNLDCFPNGSTDDPARGCLDILVADACAADGDYEIDPDGSVGDAGAETLTCEDGWTVGASRFLQDSQLEWLGGSQTCLPSAAHPFELGNRGFHGIATTGASHHLIASTPDTVYGVFEVQATLSKSWGWSALTFSDPANFDAEGHLIGWSDLGACGGTATDPFLRVLNNGSNDMANISWSVDGTTGSFNNGAGNGLDPAFVTVVARDTADIVTVRHNGVTVWTSPFAIAGPLRVAADLQNNPTATGFAPASVYIRDLSVRWRGTASGTVGACVVDCETAMDCPLDTPCETAACVDSVCAYSNDDGHTEPCYDGAVGTAGTASCMAGTATCAGGSLGPCVGQTLPTSETCDTADNDCDGIVDDKTSLIYVRDGCVDLASTGVATASQSLASSPPGNVLDACSGAWSAGGYVAWWQVELPSERLVHGVSLRPTMSPNGQVHHQIQVAGADGVFSTVLDIEQTMEDAQNYAFELPEPTLAKYVRVNTLENISWTAWVQVSVFDCGQTCEGDRDCAEGSVCTDDVGSSRCLDEDECATQAPCANGAGCGDVAGGYVCDCAGTGFVGTTCEADADECDPDPCQSGATCNDLRPPASGVGCVDDLGSIAWWTGDIDASDASGSGHDAVFLGGASSTSGQTEGALTFADGDEVRVTPAVGALNPGSGSFTVEFWVKATRAQAALEHLMIRHQFNADPAQRKRWSVSIDTGANDGKLAYLLQDGLGINVEIDGLADVRDGAWHHIAMVIDRENGQLRGYVDGANDGVNNLGALGDLSPDAILSMGLAFVGQLDEVSLYDFPLNGPEVENIYAAGAAGKCIADSYVCTDVDECAGSPCGASGDCIDGVFSYTCSCDSTFYDDGTSCAACTAIDGCLALTCSDDSNSVCSSCDDGYFADGGACTACDAVANCDTAVTCSAAGDSTCDQCATGFVWNGSQCDADDCIGNPCVNGTCTDGAGDYTCGCDEGYAFGGTSCDDIDECSVGSACSNAGTCTNTDGGFDCDCSATDYVGPTCSDAPGYQTFVGVGDGANNTRTTDAGQNWSASAPIVPGAARDVGFGAGRLVIVAGGFGDDAAAYSPDLGVNWSIATTPFGASMRGVVYGAGRFVTVGTDGASYSEDGGVTFVAASAVSGALEAVAFGGGTFLAVGSDGKAYSSADGSTWTAADHGNGDMTSVAYGAGSFVAVGTGAAGAHASYTTDGGATWTDVDTNLPAMSDVAFGSGRFVAVGASGAMTSSTAGASWDAGTGATPAAGAVAAGGGVVVALGLDATWTSADAGVTWVLGSAHNAGQLNAVTYAPFADSCDPSPCLNGGACAADPLGFTCDCAGTGFVGDTCEIENANCATNGCQNGATCLSVPPNGYTCECEPGWFGRYCDGVYPTYASQGAVCTGAGGTWDGSFCDCTVLGSYHQWTGFGCVDPSSGKAAQCTGSGGTWDATRDPLDQSADLNCDCAAGDDARQGFVFASGACADASAGVGAACATAGGFYQEGGTCDCTGFQPGHLFNGSLIAPACVLTS
ncbi:MAG: hypothetical protein ACI9MR_004139, partial [Myxococcota bacterium]